MKRNILSDFRSVFFSISRPVSAPCDNGLYTFEERISIIKKTSLFLVARKKTDEIHRHNDRLSGTLCVISPSPVLDQD